MAHNLQIIQINLDKIFFTKHEFDILTYITSAKRHTTEVLKREAEKG